MAHKNKPPAFQFYVNDWASSLQVRAMSPAQRGCYIDLLAASWPDGIPAGIPLWTLTGCRTQEEFDSLKELVLAQFQLQDGALVHPKLAQQWKELRKYHRTQQDKAKKGANARWHGSGMSQALPDDASSSSISPSISSSSSSSKINPSDNNQQVKQQSETRQSKPINPNHTHPEFNAKTLIGRIFAILQFVDVNPDGKNLTPLRFYSNDYLCQAAGWAVEHKYWGQLFRKSDKDFVRACRKEGALLDQFEDARKAGWKPQKESASDTEADIPLDWVHGSEDDDHSLGEQCPESYSGLCTTSCKCSCHEGMACNAADD